MSADMSTSWDDAAYTHYVVVDDASWKLDKRIESGWHFRSDALDHVEDSARFFADTGARVLARRTLKSYGLDPKNNEHWYTIGGVK